MKYCTHCGNQLEENAVICTKCGCPTDLYYRQQTNSTGQQTSQSLTPLSIVGFVFAFLSPLVGLICSIIAYRSAGIDKNARSRSFSLAGIIISAVLLAIEIIGGIIYGIWLSSVISSHLWYYY